MGAGARRDPGSRPSAWAPLRHRTYAILWAAQLGSNIGSWMQTVGGQWYLVENNGTPLMVSLMQTANLAPALLLALVAGALADSWDRRRLLIATNSLAAAASVLLTVVAFTGALTPTMLLSLALLIGTGVALSGPAWQSIQPDLVPRQEIPAASALGGMSVNLARAVGPALAGAMLSLWGPGVVFAVNAASFVATALVLWRWETAPVRPERPERFLSAVRTGVRFVRSAPMVRRLLLRGFLFLWPGSALWALLPVAAAERLGLDSGGYGLLLGTLGVGALVGVATLPRLRRLGTNGLLCWSALLFAAGTLGAALLPVWALLPLLLLAGTAWIMSLSTINGALQLTLPNWVRARGLAVYLMVLSGAQALGAASWGGLGNLAGAETALLVAAGVLVLTAVSLRFWPVLPRTGEIDSTPVRHTVQMPAVRQNADMTGPVWVDVEYDFGDRQREGIAALKAVGRLRRRTGAVAWELLVPLGSDLVVERSLYTGWEEYVRHSEERLTAEDEHRLDAAAELARSEPVVRYAVHVLDDEAAARRSVPPPDAL